MKKTCRYCGRLHDVGYVCPYKPKIRANKKTYDYDAYRNTQEWKKLRERIRERDTNLCQVCIRGLYNYGARTYNGEDISVHHIMPLKDAWAERNNENNLISLCPTHHKMADRGEIPREILEDIVREQESAQ